MTSLEDLTVDQLLARAQQTERAEQLLDTLVNNPETREATLRLVKKVNPSLTIPEIDAKDAVLGKVTATDDRIKQLEERLQMREIEENIRQRRKAVQEKYRLSDTDLEQVEQLMVDKEAPIPSYEAAAKVYKAQQQLAVPTGGQTRGAGFEMPSMETWKNGIGNAGQLDKIAMGEALKALNEITQQNA